jgi:hypothetical protein
MNTDQILYEAGKAFTALDKAKAAMRVAEADIATARRQYDRATGTFGIRAESLRNLVEARHTRFRKTA